MVAPDQVLHTGLLFKKGSGIGYPFGRKNWRTRYFVLTVSTLTYYAHEGGKWKGALDLTTCAGVDGDDHAVSVKAIEVMPLDSLKTGSSASTIWRIAVNTRDRRLLVAATTEREMNEWIEMLTLAIRINHTQLHLHRPSAHRMSLPDCIGSSTDQRDSVAFVSDFQPLSNRQPRTSIEGQRKIIETEAEAEALAIQRREQFDDDVRELLRAKKARHTRRMSLPTALEFHANTSRSSMSQSQSISDFQNFTPYKSRMSATGFPRSGGSRMSLGSLGRVFSSEDDDDNRDTQPQERPTDPQERRRAFSRFRQWLSRQS